jgi:hypothetical protein
MLSSSSVAKKQSTNVATTAAANNKTTKQQWHLPTTTQSTQANDVADTGKFVFPLPWCCFSYFKLF